MNISSVKSRLRKHQKEVANRNVIRRYLKNQKEVKKLTKAQKKEIQDFYQGLIGRKVSLLSHQYFYTRSGVFSKEYVPNDLYFCDILPKANNFQMSKVYGDKNMIDLLFAGENMPHTHLKNMNSYFYYEDQAVTFEEAIKLCQNLGDAVVKPSKLSKGRGVRLVTIENGVVKQTGETVKELLEKYKKDFLIQERIHQHEKLAALNPTSVNTLRILSYRSGVEVLIVYAVIRVGRKGQEIDNQSAGGLSTTIDKFGRLGKYAVGGSVANSIDKTDTGVVFDGYEIPSYDKAIEMVKRLHLKLPFFSLIGWDISIDKIGNPILIEFNTKPGLSQSAFGSGFGEHTARIIKEVWHRRNTRFGV